MLKRLVICALALIMSVFLCSCPSSSDDLSSEEEISNQNGEESESGQSGESENSNMSSDIPTPVITPVSVMYFAYDQSPYAVMVGTCEDGAVVRAVTSDGQSVFSQSFYGWFSVRVKYSSGLETTLTQEIGGVRAEGETLYGKPPTRPGDAEGVVAGGNFQFFYEKCLRDFKRQNLPSESALNSLTNRIKTRVNELKNNGMNTKIIYIIAPSVISIYPELVPDEYAQGAGKTKRQLIIEAIRKGGAVAIDLDEVFTLHKYDELPLYYKTDSHWTEYGAFVAYRELFGIIKEDFPSAAPYDFDYFDWYSGYFKTGDMLNYLKMTSPVYLTPGFFDSDCLEYSFFRSMKTDVTGVERKRFKETGVYSEEVTYRHFIAANRPELPNAIVIRDSYGTQLTDLIAGNLNNTLFQKMWDYTYSVNNIVRYNADYVIYILSEWNADQALYG